MMHARPAPAAPRITTARTFAVVAVGLVILVSSLAAAFRLDASRAGDLSASSGSSGGLALGSAAGGSPVDGPSSGSGSSAVAPASTQPSAPAVSSAPEPQSDPTETVTTTVVRTSVYQEGSSTIAYSGPWSQASSSKYSGGGAKYSRTAGATASFTFTGTSVSWVGPVGPTRGKAKVYVNGIYKRTVDLYASTYVARKTIYTATYGSQATRTLKIVVLGTAGRPIVAIDNLVIRRLATITLTLPTFPADTTLRFLSTPSASRPGYLSPMTDPVLGTRTTRVSNTAGVRHVYSRLSAWNRDGTKILLGFTYPGRMLDGTTFADLGSFRQLSQAIWSNVDPNKLYGIVGNALYSQNATTAAISKIRAFTGYTSLTIGDYEGGISDDDRVIALIGTTSTGTRQLFTYDLAANSVLGTITVTSINNAQVSRKGNYVVVVNNPIGTARGQGVERYTADLSSRINLTAYPRHGDNALDASGNEIYVANNAPYVVAFRLSTGTGTRLLTGTTAYEYGHVSGRNLDRPGWVYLSVFDNSATAGRAGHDQVIAVKTDGSGTVEVFAFSHHSGTVYANQPQAVPAPDGRRVMFASEWGGTGVYAYIASR